MPRQITKTIILEIARRVRGRAGPNAVAAECFDYAINLAAQLAEAGYEPFIVGGGFRCDRAAPTESSDQDRDDLILPEPYATFASLIKAAHEATDELHLIHYWVECEGWLIDLTADQFYKWMEIQPPAIIVRPLGQSDRHFTAARQVFPLKFLANPS